MKIITEMVNVYKFMDNESMFNRCLASGLSINGLHSKKRLLGNKELICYGFYVIDFDSLIYCIK